MDRLNSVFQFHEGLNWNARGVDEPENLFFLHYLVSQFSLGFLGIHVTKKSSFSVPWLNSTSGRVFFSGFGFLRRASLVVF